MEKQSLNGRTQGRKDEFGCKGEQMSDGSMEQSLKSSHLAGGNLDYLDELYEHYLADSNSVPNEWRQYFDSLPRVEG